MVMHQIKKKEKKMEMEKIKPHFKKKEKKMEMEKIKPTKHFKHRPVRKEKKLARKAAGAGAKDGAVRTAPWERARHIEVTCDTLHVTRMSLYACLMRQNIAQRSQSASYRDNYLAMFPNDVSFDMCYRCKQGRENLKLLDKEYNGGLKVKRSQKYGLVMQAVVAVLVFAFASLFQGCAATQVAIDKKDLVVTSSMTDPIFVTPGLGRNVYVNVQNMTSLKVASETLQNGVVQQLQAKGYNVVMTPDAADYVLQAQLVDATADINPAYKVAGQPGAAESAGAVAGALLGAGTNSLKSTLVGAGIGSLVGGIAETVSGAAVKDVRYNLTFAVKVSERATEKSSQTRITVTVGKVNLDPRDGTNILVDNSCRIIANIL